MATNNLPQTNHLMLTGILLIIFGVIAIATPAVAGTAVVFVIGAVLLIAGIVQFVQGLREESWLSKLVPLVLGLVTALCGVGVLGHPLLGLGFLTLLLAAFFVVEGIWKIIASFSYRPAPGWLFMLASGAIGLVLGVLIWNQWPLSGLLAVGILVGVDLLMTGMSMVALSTTVGRCDKLTPGAGASRLSQSSPT
jgi:uncharacterized membrane protein HdeD (DUF308 family)